MIIGSTGRCILPDGRNRPNDEKSQEMQGIETTVTSGPQGTGALR